MGSVKLLKELKKHNTEYNFYHKIEKGENDEVVGKVVGKDFVTVLKTNSGEVLEKDEKYLLNHLLTAIEKGLQIRLHPSHIMLLVRMSTQYEELDGLDELVMHLRGRGFKSEEELIEWERVIKSLVGGNIEIEDLSSHYMTLKIDDGLHDFDVLVSSSEVEEVNEGMVVDVTLKPTDIKGDNGYIVSHITGKDFKYEVVKIDILTKGGE